jgi:hypothetical protein
VSERDAGTIRLVAATDAYFTALGANAAPDGLRLPDGGVETREIVEMLAGLARTVRLQIDPAAWLIVDGDEVVGSARSLSPLRAQG